MFKDNMTLRNVYTYASPAYADTEFQKSFQNLAKDVGANIWRVELNGDAVPTLLTPEASNSFTRYDYGQVGSKFSLEINKASGASQPHSFEAYQDAFDALVNKSANAGEAKPSEPDVNQASKVQPDNFNP